MEDQRCHIGGGQTPFRRQFLNRKETFHVPLRWTGRASGPYAGGMVCAVLGRRARLLEISASSRHAITARGGASLTAGALPGTRYGWLQPVLNQAERVIGQSVKVVSAR